MSFILVTNDDGVDSPALVPFLHALGEIAPVRAVVPDRERSWIGKAITRWHDLRVERVERGGLEIHTVDGYPADCTHLGVHSLFGARPSMVVSGINIGYNHGRAFLLSSGTVGAAAEGWIAGCPALAFSTGVQWGGSHRPWAREAWSKDAGPLWARASAIAADVVRIVRLWGFPPEADLLSVNFPANATVETPRRVTKLAKVAYDNLFRERLRGRFVHDFTGSFRKLEGIEGTDLAAAREGTVAITPVRLAHTAEISERMRKALER